MTTPRPFPFTPSRRGFVGMSAAALATVALASCSSDAADEVDLETQNVGAMDDYAADVQFKATEPIKLTMLWTDWPRVRVRASGRTFNNTRSLPKTETC